MTICLRTRRWPSRRQALRSCVYFLAMVSSPRSRAASSHTPCPLFRLAVAAGSPSCGGACLFICNCILHNQLTTMERCAFFCRARGRGRVCAERGTAAAAAWRR